MSISSHDHLSHQSRPTPSVAERLAALEKPSTQANSVIDWENLVRQSMVDLSQAYKTLLLKENGSEMDNPELVGCLDHLSEIHHALGNYAIAESYYRRGLRIKEKFLPKGDTRLVRGYLNLGILHRIQRDFDQAEELYLRGLRSAADPDHRNVPEAARCLFHLAGMFHAQGRYLEAGSLLKKALQDFEEQSRTSDFVKAVGRAALGLIFIRQGNTREGKTLISAARVLASNEIGPFPHNLEHKLITVALVYSNWERYDEAEFLIRQAVTSREEHLWQYQPMLPGAIVTIANLCSARGQSDEAEFMYWAALEKQAKSTGPYHKTMIDALTKLASFYLMNRRYEDAEPLLENAVKLSQVVNGEESWETAARMEQHAAVLEKLGKTGESLGIRKRIKTIRQH